MNKRISDFNGVITYYNIMVRYLLYTISVMESHYLLQLFDMHTRLIVHQKIKFCSMKSFWLGIRLEPFKSENSRNFKFLNAQLLLLIRSDRNI